MVGVSVIIPFSRFKAVRSTLKSLVSQTGAVDFEVIIVGFGSNKINTSSYSLKIRTIDSKIKLNPARARNIGASKAKGRALLFLDDDCVVSKNWLTASLQALTKRGVGVVGGMVKGFDNNFFSQTTDYSNFDSAQLKKPSYGPVCSSTMAVLKKNFVKVGGFNEKLRTVEDIDFCYRLELLGLKSYYEPKVVVYHRHRIDNLGKLIGHSFYWGRKSGLYIATTYPNRTVGNMILSRVTNPLLFFLFLLPLSFYLTAKSVIICFRDNKGVFWHLPFIFLAKTSYNLGTLYNLLRYDN